MVNHMAQGAATSMEDGAFLGRTVHAAMQGRISMKEAIGIYEKTRMPLAHVKQQVSFLNGAIWQLPDGPRQEVSRHPLLEHLHKADGSTLWARDKAMSPELEGEIMIRSPNLYGDPQTVMRYLSRPCHCEHLY
jgi:salicylate hydroxylase